MAKLRISLFFLVMLGFSMGARGSLKQQITTGENDELLKKITRELLKLEIEDLKKDIKKEGNTQPKGLIIDSNEKQNKIRDTDKDKDNSELKPVEEEKKSSDEGKSNIITKLAKRMMDLSKVHRPCLNNLGDSICNSFYKYIANFCQRVPQTARQCKKTCKQCGYFDAYPKYCKYQADKCLEQSVSGDFVREKCAKTCWALLFGKACKDKNKHCSH